MPYRVGKLFAYMAENDGSVTNLTDKSITVTYSDGTMVTAPIGQRFGVAEGTTYPHNLVTPLTATSKFKKGDCITYNTNFFEPDWLNSKNIIYKMSLLTTTALNEGNNTYEDSSGISTSLASRLATTVTKTRSFVLEFNKNIVNMLPVGTKVKPEDVLFLLTDGDVGDSVLSDDSIMLLKRLANVAPKAKVIGTIVKHEVLYNGDPVDMSPSLRKLVTKCNSELASSTKGTEAEIKNGEVNSEYRVDGKNLQVDTLELKVYIDVPMSMSIGDKTSFSGSLKSVVGEKFDYSVTTESGTTVDAFFGLRGIFKRVVMTPIIQGTTNRLLKNVSKQVADVYFS